MLGDRTQRECRDIRESPDQDDRADEPTDDGAAGGLFRFGGEELLIHGLIAEHQQTGGQKELHGLN